MKNNCRKVLAALVLSLAFSSSAFANDGIMYPNIVAPPPPATNGVIQTEVETNGIIWPGASAALKDMGLTLLGLATRL